MYGGINAGRMVKQYCYTCTQELAYLMSVINYIVKVIEKLRTRSEQFYLQCQNGFQKDRSYINPVFSMKLLIEKRREFKLETYLALLAYVKVFENVKKRDKFSKVLQSKNVPNLLLKSIIEIYSGNTTKLKASSQISEKYTVNQKVRQGCPLSPALFKAYLKEIMLEWNQIHTKHIILSTTTKFNILHFAVDRVIVTVSEANLHTAVFTFQNTAKNFGMETSPEKSEMMAFLVQDPVRCKIIVDNKCIQVKNFKYLGCEISYESVKDIQQKVAKFAQILGILI
jgi:hypothetical protein